MGNINWTGVGADILKKYLNAESGVGVSDAGNFGLDVFVNGFEDEFPAEDNGLPFTTYSPEANRASEQKPWGQEFGERPKIHELNQPEAAQVLGWRVIDFYPNRDEKAIFHRLAGTPSELRILLLLIQSIRQFSGNNINFEAWFDGWENGFPDFIENRIGNFQLANGTEDSKIWERIKNRDSRPRYREWSSSQQRANLTYRTIEYFPQGYDGMSYVLSGTDIQLINHIIQIEYLPRGGSQSSTHNPIDTPSLIGRPLIKLYFYNMVDSKIAQGEVSIRLIEESEDSLSKADLKVYAQRIVDNFAGFVWSKGRNTLTYNNPKQGIKGFYYCKTKSDGINLITRLLKIVGEEIILAKCRISENLNPDEAYPLNPPEKQILGESIKPPIRRPIVDVRFVFADLFLPSRSPIRLVDRSNRILV